MTERGFTILEVILTGAIVAMVMVGLGTFYLSTVQFSNENAAQTALQRQASFIVDEMARQIAPATLLEYPVACGGDPNGLRATNSCGTFCFFRGVPNGSALTAILETRTLNGTCPNHTSSTATVNLLSGALVSAKGDPGLLSTLPTSTACAANGANGGFCPDLIRRGDGCIAGAVVWFRLRYQVPESQDFQLMTFSTSVGRRSQACT
jgi:type II secretory pathway pseudopilin PulG